MGLRFQITMLIWRSTTTYFVFLTDLFGTMSFVFGGRVFTLEFE